MAGIRDEDEVKPLDPASERLRQRLVRFMAINLVVVFGVLFIVVGVLVYRYIGRNANPPVAAEPAPPLGDGMLVGTIALPAGSRVVTQSLSGERLSLDVELPGGARTIFLYDTRLARIVARYDVTVSP